MNNNELLTKLISEGLSTLNNVKSSDSDKVKYLKELLITIKAKKK
jgi:hypothetical protein